MIQKVIFTYVLGFVPHGVAVYGKDYHPRMNTRYFHFYSKHGRMNSFKFFLLKHYLLFFYTWGFYVFIHLLGVLCKHWINLNRKGALHNSNFFLGNYTLKNMHRKRNNRAYLIFNGIMYLQKWVGKVIMVYDTLYFIIK